MLQYSFLKSTIFPRKKKSQKCGCKQMKPHWVTEMRQGVRANGEGYPVYSGAPGPTKECNDLSTTGLRSLNPYRWSTETCEPWCSRDVCHEYGNKLEKYFDCLRCGKKNCKKPINPKQRNCV